MLRCRALVTAGVEVSCVDATNPVVFVRARDLGLTGTESPQAVDADHEVSGRLEKLRVEAGARMGMAESAAVPKIAYFTLDRYGHLYPEADQALRDRLDALHALSLAHESAALDGPETDQPASSRLEDSVQQPPHMV